MTYWQRGFSLVELMVAIAISLFLSLGLFTMFSMSTSNVKTTSQVNNLQENGRLALTILEQDLSQLGFLGDITGTELIVGQNTALDASLAITTDCAGGGLNNATFPSTHSTNSLAHFRRLWGYQHTAGAGVDCLSDVVEGSDVIQMKRVLGPNDTTPNDPSNIYLGTTSTQAVFFEGQASPPFIANARYWEYQHRYYYLKEVDDLFTLSRVSLSASGMNNHEALVSNIENMQILYGFDDNGDGSADRFLPSEDVDNQMWDNAVYQQLVALRIYLLVRSETEDLKYTNSTSYQLGDLAIAPANDHYRRKVFSTTIALENPLIINTN